MIKNEIGSEFWSVQVKDVPNHFFPKNTQWFLSGRSALTYILKDIIKKSTVHTVALPSWCCESMIIPFLKAGLKVYFYPVYFFGGQLVQEPDLTCDVILVMDYFGYASSRDYSSYPGTVIRDLTHSIFSGFHQDADYYFGSLRKWSGFLTGGFAWGEQLLPANILVPDRDYVHLRQQAMLQKKMYMEGKCTDKVYLRMFGNAEERLDTIHAVQGADDTDIANASMLDIEYIKKRRRENATVLLNSIREMAVFPEPKDSDCPLFVPIYLKERDKLKKHLIQNHVYCPVHWPVSQYHSLEKKCQELYDREISLVCDQRYSAQDMEYICELIKTGV